MTAVSVDFNKLLGFKLIVRAHAAMRSAGEGAHLAEPCESASPELCGAILQARIGNKPVPGLRFGRS